MHSAPVPESRMFRVETAYDAAYPAPLSAAVGDTLRIERRDTEWPGWLWGVASDGVAGWVPEAWLRIMDVDTATLLRDYTARELTLAAGDLLTAAFTESGWRGATDAAGGSGWVPVRNLVRT